MGGKSKIEDKDTAVNRKGIYCPDGTGELLNVIGYEGLSHLSKEYGIYTRHIAEDDMFLHAVFVCTQGKATEMLQIRKVMTNALTCTVIVPKDVIIHAHKDFICKSSKKVNILYLNDSLNDIDIVSWIDRLFSMNHSGEGRTDKLSLKVPPCLFSETALKNIDFIYRMFGQDPSRADKKNTVLKRVINIMTMNQTDYVYIDKKYNKANISRYKEFENDKMPFNLHLWIGITLDYCARSIEKFIANPSAKDFFKNLIKKNFHLIQEKMHILVQCGNFLKECYLEVKKELQS